MSPGLRVSLFQAAVFASGGVSTAFLSLWLAQCGLSTASVGQVLGLAALLRLGAVPLWGELADRIGRVRPVLTLAALLSALLSLAYLPAYGFLGVLLVAVLQGFAATALMPLTDTIALALARENRLQYGPVRGSGSAVWLVSAAATGPVVAAAGPVAIRLMMALWCGLAAALGPLLPLSRAVPRPRTVGSLRLLRNRAFVLTLAASALIQSSNAGYYALATLHWRNHGIGDTVIGLLWAEGVLAETILFLVSAPLVRRLGPAGLTALGGAGAALRWAVTATTTDPWALAAVQWLHCCSYCMQHLSAMTMLSRHVPAERAATAQTLHASLGVAAPTGLMMWIAGLLYAGEGRVFFLMAGLGAAALALSPALRRC